MPQVAKPISVIKAEGNKRRLSKKAMEQRENTEKSLATEEAFKEWEDTKNNIVSHKLFLRLSKLFAKIDKNDALLETTINRYCLLHADVKTLEERKNKVMGLISEAEDDSDMDMTDKVKSLTSLYKILNSTDTKVMQYNFWNSLR